MNLFVGARLELPWVSPFLQVSKGVGEFDALAVGGGVELTLRERSGTPSSPEPMRFALTPYLVNNIAGDVRSGRGSAWACRWPSFRGGTSASSWMESCMGTSSVTKTWPASSRKA